MAIKKTKTFITSKYLSMLGSGTVLMVLAAMMGIADTLIAGIILGEEAVAGICLALPVYSMASFFAVSFSYGVPILYAGKIGAFRKSEADRCFGVGLTAASLVGVLLFAAILFGKNLYLSFFPVDEKVYFRANEYLEWMKFAVLLLPLNELLDGMLFADGDETISLTANLTQGLLKIVLSVILCRSLGVKGMALATFISFAVSILISFLHFFRPGNTLKLNVAFSPTILRDIVKYSIVDGSTFLFASLFTTVITVFVTNRFGPDMLILVSVISLIQEGQILFEGIGEAITPIISTYLGEETYPGVRKVWKLALWSLWVMSLLFTAFLLAGAPLIVSLLGIQDPAMKTYAVWGMRILSLSLAFICRLFLDSSYYILVGKISLGVLDAFLRDLFPALPFAVAGGMIGGIYGMFIGLMLAPPLGYLLSVLYIRYRYGRENYALFLADMEQRKKVELFEFPVRPDAIIQVRDQLGLILKKNSCTDRQINRAMLLFEELFMLIYECNPGKTVLAECAVGIGKSIHLISKDNGRIIDLTDTDRDISSLRAYTLSNLLEVHTVRRAHILALSYNRNALEIR